MLGVSPSNPGAFFEKLISMDDGWVASYFDAVSRVDNPRLLAYLTQPERMRRFYDALRGKVTSPGPARPVFRSSTELMLLTTSLRVDANGQAHVPGDLEVWRTLFIKHPHGKYDGKLTRAAASWRTPDDLMEALFALSRKTADNDPLKIFLTINDIERGRSQPLSPDLTARLINDYRAYGDQYRMFADAPSLSEASISNYLSLCAEILPTMTTRCGRTPVEWCNRWLNCGAFWPAGFHPTGSTMTSPSPRSSQALRARESRARTVQRGTERSRQHCWPPHMPTTDRRTRSG